MTARAATSDRRRGSPPGDALDAALDTVVETALRAIGASEAIAGVLQPDEPGRVRSSPNVERAFLDALCQSIGQGMDGPIESPWGGADGWSGRRAAVGDGRTAFAMVRVDRLNQLGSAVLEASLLSVVRAALLDRDRSRADQLNQLLANARRVTESLELDTVLSAIVHDAGTLLGADSGDMLLFDDERVRLRVVAVWNFPPEMLGFELDFGEGLSSEAILAQRTLQVDDYQTYEQRARALDRYDFGSVLCAPLLFRGSATGALNVHARGRRRKFSPGDADLLGALASHAAIAIDHARRYENEVRLGRDLAHTNRELSRSLMVQQRLAEQVLLDGGSAGIARVLAEQLGRSTVIQDHLHRPIAGASPDGGDDWQGLNERAPGAALEMSTVDPANREPFAVAVRVGRDVVGHLLLSADQDLGPIDRALVDIATTGVALEFAKERAAIEVEERLREAAATELLSGSYPSEQAISGRAARLGYDLGQPHDLVVIDVAIVDGIREEARLGGHDQERRLVDLVRERLVGRAPRSLTVAHSGSIVVLASLSRRGSPGSRELATDVKRWLEAVTGEGTVTIAIGDRCSRPDDYAPAFRLGRASLDVMLKLGRQGAIVGAAELGPYGLLIRATSRDELEAFARRTLRPLLDQDRKHPGDLLPTLRAYLEEDRVQRRAATRCVVHVNTIVYRLRRIQDLLGVRLDDPATVFEITLALRILDLLEPPTDAIYPGEAAWENGGHPAVNA